jgi:glutamyl-tRNA synthetase/nondiscriminating glutamyl-tRNA synthetase
LYNNFILYLSRFDKEYLEYINQYPKDYNKKILDELKTKIKKFDEYK